MKILLIALTFIFNNYFSQEVFEGYTLFTPQSGGNIQTVLLNNNQETVHFWSHERGPASMPYLLEGEEPGLENCILVYPYRVPNPTMNSGGVGGGVQFVDWNSNILWDFELSNEQYQHHHDVEPISNGNGGYNILMVAWEAFTQEEAYAMGRAPGSINNPLNQMWATAILEVEPYTNVIVWEWHLWDHMVQDLSPDYGATFGNIENHPELININEGPVGAGGGPGNSNADWIHVNAIDYNETLDQIAISSRFMSEIYVIDHSTTIEEAASHVGGNSGKGGDILYRWGNPQNYNRGSNASQILVDQHSVNWIPYGYPGEGNLLVFNNRHNGLESAGIEFSPPINENGIYDINETDPYGPEEPTWIYHPGANWFSRIQSGAFRLPNGNTLFTVAEEAEIFEVTYQGEVVWEYNHPDASIMIPRAQKYAIDAFDYQPILGDINGDEILNVLDVILVVNMILGILEIDLNADINDDNGINVLDVVLLVNEILN